MSRYKESSFKAFIIKISDSYIPNKRDNLKQIFLKLLFFVGVIVLLCCTVYLSGFFLEATVQEKLLQKSRNMWHYNQNVEFLDDGQEEEIFNDIKMSFHNENNDFSGWITITNTKIDNPIYQKSDNKYYLNHNQKGQKSSYGSLFFDCENVISEDKTDSNLVIYGKNLKNGAMFGELEKLTNLNFYKKNPTIKFSTNYKTATYKIYAVYILNSVKADDDGYIYNIYRNRFSSTADFKAWIDEAYSRSIIDTGVDVEYGDNIITLVTDSDAFKNARLVVMAREMRKGESTLENTAAVSINKNIRFPKRWYDERSLEYAYNSKN